MNPWPLGETWVVSYILDGELRATRHLASCRMLLRARHQVDEGLDAYHVSGRPIQRLAVVEEARYEAARRSRENEELPPPQDHVCCKGMAATASFQRSPRRKHMSLNMGLGAGIGVLAVITLGLVFVLYCILESDFQATYGHDD